MRQLISSLRTGELSIEDVPVPAPWRGSLLIQSRASLISAGTERMLVDFGRAHWIDKARQQPDKVREVVGKIRTDGMASTAEAVRSKLDQPLPLGYCNVGIVREIGEKVTGFSPGDRVVSNGAHAEVVSAPMNLCARIPEKVPFEAAVYTVPAAVALQGIRLVRPTLGECFVVTGLGLIGQLAVQLLLANGCRVLGIDPDAEKRELAAALGVDAIDPGKIDVLSAADRFSRSRGVDGVIITASTSSSEPVSQAAKISRKRGRIVLVGVAGLNLSRGDFYEKELTFQVSCSYGPGRYDADYEEKGHDYPVGFVRWTEQRNFEAVLDMMARGALDTSALTTHRFPLEQAGDAYELLSGDTPSLGIMLEYPHGSDELALDRTVPVSGGATAASPDRPSVAFVGAGNYAGRVLIPAFKAGGATLRSITATSGVGPSHYGGKFGFERAGTDSAAAIGSADVNTVVIATRHDSHAELVCRAIDAGKHVFVEKPLALSLEEIERIETTVRQASKAGKSVLMTVGFNRRFSPLAIKARTLLQQVAGPKAFIATINAGPVDPGHWTRDKATGGGRIIGEACHFVDLLRYFADSPIAGVHRRAMGEGGVDSDDTAGLDLRFEDGSIGTIHYLANGSKLFPKERIEVFASGRILQLDNFRTLHGWGWPDFRRQRLWRQDKGQVGCVGAFLECIRKGRGQGPIPFDELIEVSRASIELAADG